VARLEEALLDYEAGLEDRFTNFVAIHRRLGRNGYVAYYGFGEIAASKLNFSALLGYWPLKAMLV